MLYWLKKKSPGPHGWDEMERTWLAHDTRQITSIDGTTIKICWVYNYSCRDQNKITFKKNPLLKLTSNLKIGIVARIFKVILKI